MTRDNRYVEEITKNINKLVKTMFKKLHTNASKYS